MRRKTWINAIIGAVATVVLSFTIVSPILGGALAGYLERASGVRVGAISGVVATLPLLLLIVAVVGLVLVTGSGFSGFEILILIVLVVIVPLFVVGLSAIGGYLGVYMGAEFGR